jgi:hypothetical protein
VHSRPSTSPAGCDFDQWEKTFPDLSADSSHPFRMADRQLREKTRAAIDRSNQIVVILLG